MFNPDGTHRADSDIATDVNRAIETLIKEGVIKQKDAPAKPITGFDDANKYLDNYPTGPTESVAPSTAPPSAAPAPAAPTPGTPTPVSPTPTASTTTAPVKAEPCPADRPWLCDTPPPPVATPKSAAAPANTPASSKSNSPAKTSSAPAKPNPAKPAPATAGKSATAAAKPASTAGETPAYMLGPNDVVLVTVFDEGHVSGTYPIGPDGRLSMPLIGNFKAIDMTLIQLSDLITDKLRDQGGILEPVVNVQLLRNNSKQYTLVGGTLRTGPVPLLRDTTILDALAAVGFKEFANKKKIILRRGTQEFKFNYEQVIKGVHLEQNILIQDGDYIFVKE